MISVPLRKRRDLEKVYRQGLHRATSGLVGKLGKPLMKSKHAGSHA